MKDEKKKHKTNNEAQKSDYIYSLIMSIKIMSNKQNVILSIMWVI